jgi:hypothetical protein
MKSLRSILIVAVCALAGLPAWGAVEVAERVDYLPGAQPDDTVCTWEASMAVAAVERSKGAITPAGKAPAISSLRLSLQVAQLKLSRTAKGSDYAVVIRGNVAREGKLLATRDFDGDGSVKNGQPACDTLRAIGASIGERAAKWVSRTRFMECRDDCTGIHPDETIVVGAEILMGNDDAINDTVRDECRWPTTMVGRLVTAFNDGDPSPRAKLESRAIDIEKYAGRRLVLRVNNVHAVGGGGFSGPKWMDMSGELREGNTLVANFNSHTSSGHGFTMCKSVDSLSESTSDMIVEWLRSPTLGAKLD